MSLAMEAVNEKRSSISQAARDYGVPYTTLHDRLSGKITHGVNPGPRHIYPSVRKMICQLF